jgi:outer membrane protein assembly factor BamD
MKRSIALGAALLVSAATLAGCGEKTTKVASEEAREGRDRALLADGIKELQGGHLNKSRLLFNTLINTYPDSPFVSVTKLALADSFYREGKFSTMNQAEVEYRDWLQFFPKHRLADDVMMKIAEVHMRQVQAADRDTTHARLAERQLLKLLDDYPNTDLKERAESQLWEIREILGLHELKVARYYFNRRQAYKAATARTKEILDKYPDFSRRDEALFIMGRALYEMEDTEEAIRRFTEICRLYPESEYFEDSVKYLKLLDAEVPEPAPDGERPLRREGPGLIGRLLENVSHPRLDYISKDGVLFKRGESAEAALERAVEFSSDTGEGASTSRGD